MLQRRAFVATPQWGVLRVRIAYIRNGAQHRGYIKSASTQGGGYNILCGVKIQIGDQ